MLFDFIRSCGRSSAVELLPSKQIVVGSNPIARSNPPCQFDKHVIRPETEFQWKVARSDMPFPCERCGEHVFIRRDSNGHEVSAL